MEHLVILKSAVLLVVGLVAMDVAPADMECVVLPIDYLVNVVPLIHGKSGNKEAFRFLFQIIEFFFFFNI